MTTFQVNDMTCGHCVSAITKAVSVVDSSTMVKIDLAMHRVEIGQTNATVAQLSAAIAESGYTPEELEVVGVGASAAPQVKGGCCGGCGCR